MLDPIKTLDSVSEELGEMQSALKSDPKIPCALFSGSWSELIAWLPDPVAVVGANGVLWAVTQPIPPDLGKVGRWLVESVGIGLESVIRASETLGLLAQTVDDVRDRLVQIRNAARIKD